MDNPSLLGLTDELLLKVLLLAGAPAVARAATLCRRLRAAKEQLSALPAFASAACFQQDDVSESVRSAVLAAREQMPATMDFCLVFVAGNVKDRKEGGVLNQVVPECQALLPPGTQVVGCCGRGVFGLDDGVPRELDPAQLRKRAVSVLLGRRPGCTFRAIAAAEPPSGGVSACRAWLGLGEPGSSNGTAQSPALEPLVCLLFAHPGTGSALWGCLDVLQKAFPQLLITGGVSSGMCKLFSSGVHTTKDAQQQAAADGMEGAGAKGFQQLKDTEQHKYVALLVCQERGEADMTALATGLTAQGMHGMDPVLRDVEIIRDFGTMSHPHHEGEEEVTELIGVMSAKDVEGNDAAEHLSSLGAEQAELGLWAAKGPDFGTFDSAASAGQPVAVLQLYGTVQGEEALAAANDDAALAAVMEAAAQQGHTLCAQPLKLVARGAQGALRRGVQKLAGDRPSAHPLLPTTNMGLVLVSCTAKGRQMYGAVSTEAQLVHDASAQLPMAGVYCDGEIGPQVFDGKLALQRAGEAAPKSKKCACSRVQGFTTIVTALSG